MERRCLRQGAYNGDLNNPGRQLSAEGNAEGQNAQPHQLFRTVRGKGRTVGEHMFEVMHGKPGKHGFSGAEDGAGRHGGVQGADGDVRFGKKEVFKGFVVELQRFSAQRQTENACEAAAEADDAEDKNDSAEDSAEFRQIPKGAQCFHCARSFSFFSRCHSVRRIPYTNVCAPSPSVNSSRRVMLFDQAVATEGTFVFFM